MIYLAPVGGFYDKDFGILTTPGTRGVPSGIKGGMRWAADNQAFTQGFKPDVFFPWLGSMAKYRQTCIFVTCPDRIGDAERTLALFDKWSESLNEWPIAFVAQDGQEYLDFPPSELWSCLFVGGTTLWKMSDAATDCILRAQEIGKHIHIGRVNYFKRYRHFASLIGSEEFTTDGTRQRFEGTEVATEAWRKYMDAPKQYGLPLPRRHYRGESGDG
jgi:hypothetical protein